MAALKDEVKAFIVQALACFDTPVRFARPSRSSTASKCPANCVSDTTQPSIPVVTSDRSGRLF